MRFKKSSRSENIGGCVELALAAPGVAVRDSKNATGPMLRFDAAVLSPLIGMVKTGALNHP